MKTKGIKPYLIDEEKLAKLNDMFGAWKDRADLMATFAEIDEQRHAYRGRNLDTNLWL